MCNCLFKQWNDVGKGVRIIGPILDMCRHCSRFFAVTCLLFTVAANELRTFPLHFVDTFHDDDVPWHSRNALEPGK